MHVFRRIAGSAAVIMASLAMCRFAFPLDQTVDAEMSKLQRARIVYEDNLQLIREEVVKTVNNKIGTSSRESDGLEGTVKANEEKIAFEQRGTMPEIESASKNQDRYLKARARMLEAYRRAMTEVTDAEIRNSITDEAQRFEKQSDLGPWGANLVLDVTEASRTLSNASASLDVEQKIVGEYRLEINASTSGDTATLIVGFPLIDDRYMELPVDAEDGTIRFLVSVYDDWVSPDLGASRPVSLSKAVSSDSKKITLRSVGQSIVVKSIRTKPLIDGEPKAIAAKPKQPKPVEDNGRVAQPKDPSALLTEKSTWKGPRFLNGSGTQATTATVLARNGNVVVLSTPSWGGDGRLIWTLTVNGGRISGGDDSLRYEGPHPRSFTGVSIAGKINGESLYFEYTVRRVQIAGDNKTASGNFDLRRFGTQ